LRVNRRDRAKNALKLVSRDGSFRRDSSEDPTRAGATLRIQTDAGFDASFELPVAGWRSVRVRGGRAYRYSDPSLARGPIRLVTLMNGLIEVTGQGASLGYSLATNPDPVRVALTIGIDRFCVSFGGKRRFVARKLYRAGNSAAPAACLP
jgi:hypothetical protein